MVEKGFSGFPDRAEVTPIPNLFFSALLPEIDDLAELKVILYILWLVSRRRGNNRFVTCRELSSSAAFLSGVDSGPESKIDELKNALEKAVQRKVLLSLKVEADGKVEDLYFVNDVAGRRLVEAIQQGKVSKIRLVAERGEKSAQLCLADIFRLYEQNIGLLTPMVADELREAEKVYPLEWIESAIREAVALNKRNWRYISRILERWAVEGKDDGKTGRYPEKGVDRDKYVRGRYGHLVRR